MQQLLSPQHPQIAGQIHSRAGFRLQKGIEFPTGFPGQLPFLRVQPGQRSAFPVEPPQRPQTQRVGSLPERVGQQSKHAISLPMAAAVQAIRQCFQTILVLPQRLRRSRQMGGRAGKEFLQSGHQLQPKRIAGRTGQIVAFIVPEGNVFLPEHGFQLCFGQCQQGAQQHSPAEGRPRRDPAQALSARAPQQVHQHGLGLIVPVMSRQQRVGGKLVHPLAK